MIMKKMLATKCFFTYMRVNYIHYVFSIFRLFGLGKMFFRFIFYLGLTRYITNVSKNLVFLFSLEAELL